MQMFLHLEFFLNKPLICASLTKILVHTTAVFFVLILVLISSCSSGKE